MKRKGRGIGAERRKDMMKHWRVSEGREACGWGERQETKKDLQTWWENESERRAGVRGWKTRGIPPSGLLSGLEGRGVSNRLGWEEPRGWGVLHPL